MSRKTLVIDIDMEGPKSFTFDYTGVDRPRLDTEMDGREACLYVNRDSCLFLSRVFAKLALGEYPVGYHLHINADLDADKPEVFRIALAWPKEELQGR
jgi:hypothetical protein